MRGRSLEDMVESRHRQAVRQMQTDLRLERSDREPNFLPSIFPGEQEQNAVGSLTERDVERVAQGSTVRQNTWSFNLPNGQSCTMLCRVRLARTSLFFAAVEFQQVVATTPSHTSAYPQPPNPNDMGLSNPYASAAPRNPQYAAGPPSPYQHSAPSSPFTNIGTQMMTSLPPTGGTHPAISPAREMQYGGPGYFPRQGVPQSPSTSMQPPPQPTSVHRQSQSMSHTTPRRPESMSNIQLPPIMGTSGPTTPITANFTPEHTQGRIPTPTPASAGSNTTPINMQAQLQGLAQNPGSARGRSPSDRGADDTDGEAGRKRRRLNIGEIIDM